MSDDAVQIEYHRGLESLERLLAGVRRGGSFCVHGAVEIPLPRVEVEGVGGLSFPVPPAQAALLAAQATRAPYGRGADTILDESVRKVWQIPPEHVRIGGKSWVASFEDILGRVAAGLGIERGGVSAELYKLLVYDPGGFFLAHRDTEKEGGMFGTLILGLPSEHAGGELVVRHAGNEVTADLSAAEWSELGFAAFYADCEHEVRPVTAGHRVCLVFNLLHRHASAKRTPRAPDNEPAVAAAAAMLRERFGGPDAPVKLAWLLEHQYSPEGLGFHALKAADAARGNVLAQAAERAGCVVHLGIVHIEESGSAEGDYSGWDGGWNDEDDDGEEADFEVIEVVDSRHFISQWRDRGDAPMPFGEIPLENGELLPAGALDEEKPDKQRLLEASGNAGASFERSYHRAALVLWPRQHHAAVLLQSGPAAALPLLHAQVDAALAPGAPATARREAIHLARQMIAGWHGGDAPPPGCGTRAEMAGLLDRLGETPLLARFLAEGLGRDYCYEPGDNAMLAAAAPKLGAEKAGPLYAELVARHGRAWPGAIARLLETLAFDGGFGASAAGRGALREMAEPLVTLLGQLGGKFVSTDDEDQEEPDEAAHRAADAAFVARLLDVLGAADAGGLRTAAAAKVIARPEGFDPVRVVVPALGRLRPAPGRRDEEAARLWAHAATFLLARSGEPPVAPADWAQGVRVEHGCADCRELEEFARHPTRREHAFRAPELRRRHLEEMIKRQKLEMNTRTDQTGRPYALVCVKDRRNYRRRCSQYRRDVEALGALAEGPGRDSAAAPVLGAIATARARAAAWSPA